MFFSQLSRQFFQIAKRRVKHKTANLMIPISIHESSHSPHTPAPNSNAANRPYLPKIFEYTVDIIPFIKAKRDVVPFRDSAACKIECENRDISAEEVMNDPITILTSSLPLKPAASIAMQIDHAGQLLTWTIKWFIVTAFEDQTLLVLQFDISSLDLYGLPFEDFCTWVSSRLPRSWRVYYARGGLMMAFQSCS